MRNHIIFTLGFLFLTGLLSAQGPFIREYAVGDWTSGSFEAVEPHPMGGFLVLGSANSFQAGTKTALFRLDAKGDTLWTKAYWRNELDDRWPIDLASASDGSGFYILLGNGIPTIQYNTVLKVDLEGDSVWQTKVSNDNEPWTNAPFRSITTLTEGGCALAGGCYGFDNPPLVTRLNDDGDIMWTNAVSPSGAYSHYKKIRQGPNGDLYAVGTHSSYNPTANHRRHLVTRMTLSGNILWSKTFNAGTLDAGDMRMSEGFDVLPLTDGGCLVTGLVTDPGFSGQGQTQVMRLDGDGNVVWSKAWYGGDQNQSTGLNLVSADAEHFLLFLHKYGSSAAGATLMKGLLANGDSIWTQYGWNYPFRLKSRDPLGGLLFTGYNPSTPYGVLIRTASDGTYVPPTLNDPFNGQIQVDMPVTFVWNSNGTPQVFLQYDLQIDQDPDFLSPDILETISGSNSTTVNGLNALTTYYWRVRGRGTELGAGLWSESSVFTTSHVTSLSSPEGLEPITLFPSPATESVHVAMVLPEAMRVILQVHDGVGHIMTCLDLGIRPAGPWEEFLNVQRWDDGVYYLTLIAGDKTRTLAFVVKQ